MQIKNGIVNGSLRVNGLLSAGKLNITQLLIDGNILIDDNAISYIGSGTTKSMIRFRTGNANGHGISIGGGSSVIIGAGESASSAEATVAATDESLNLIADNVINLTAGADTFANRRTLIINGSRQFYPKMESGETSAGALGTSSARWANIYAVAANFIGQITASDTFYRAYTASNQTPMIWMNGADYDNALFTISSGTSTNNYYGYTLKYIGSGAGVSNFLRLYADNQNGTEAIGLSMNQSGQIGIQADPNSDYAFYVSGNSFLNGSVYAGTMYPKANKSFSLGSSTTWWNGLFTYRTLEVYGNESTGDESHLRFNASDKTQRAIITWNGNTDNAFSSTTHLKLATSFGDIRLDPANAYVNVKAHILPRADNTYQLGTSSYRWQYLYNTYGVTSGNLTIGVNSLNTGYKLYVQGNSYLNGAINTMATLTAGSVTSGTTAGTRSALCLYGATYGNDSTYLKTAGKLSYGDPGPQIIFGTDSTLTSAQKAALIFTDHDTIGTGNSLSLVSTESNCWFIAPTIKALSKLYVTGNADITGSITSLAVNGGIYWSPYVESSTDNSDATSITVLKSGVAGGTELRIQQANDSTDVINLVAPYYIYLNSKRAFTIYDSWLRINEDLGFSSGIYTGNSLVRTDYRLEVGSSGAGFYATASGSGYLASNLNIANTVKMTASAIQYTANSATYSLIRFRANTSNTYGHGISIGHGGSVIIGAGESGSSFESSVEAGDENLYLMADSNIYFCSNCDTIANRKTMTYNTSGTLTVPGAVISTNADGFRIVYGNYGVFLRNDGSNTYFLLTDSGNQYSSWNSLRPFYFNNANGQVTFGHNVYHNGLIYFTGNSNEGYIGPANSSWFHFQANRDFYFSNNVAVNGTIYPYANMSTGLGSSSSEFNVGWIRQLWNRHIDGTTANGMDGNLYIQYNRTGYMTYLYSHTQLQGGKQLRRDGVSSSWHNARDGAVIRMNTVNGYSPILSMKTTNGDWAISTYDSSSYQNKIIFSYVADSNYNVNNTSIVYTIDTNGYFSGSCSYASNADTVDGQHFTWSNSSNSPTYLWATNSNGSAFLCHRASMSVNYANSAGSASSATTASGANGLNSTGWGNGNFTYLQTSGDFYGNSGWCHYLISNHGSGETYYNWTIALPFWGGPRYKRQEGSTSATHGWYDFITSENIGSQSVSYATNCDTVDGYHASSLAKLATYNDLTHSGNEFTFASAAFSGGLWINYRTASGSLNGNITTYYFGNGKGGYDPRLMAGGASFGYNNTSYALSTSSFICNSWIRTKGSTGWYNEDYGGGWYMIDSTWIRAYNNKQIYTGSSAQDAIRCDGGLTCGCLLLSNVGWTGYGTADPSSAGLTAVTGRVYFRIV